MFQENLLEWYKKNHRILPWRENHKPYSIWLSEVMLQQTQVTTVIDYFNRFIEKYPSVYDLALAKEGDVLKLWEGLGYYSRARRLIPCSKMIVAHYDGVFPNSYKELMRLPGVGSYTAGAILSIAFNEKISAVDGNVMRVYSRLFNMSEDISDPKTKKVFEDRVFKTLPEDRRHFNQALMELGATICTPKKTKCLICPIEEFCEAFKLNLVGERPVKSKKIKKKIKQMVVCKLIDDHEMMIEHRPSEGLLAGLWGFPCYEIEGDLKTTVLHNIKDSYDMDVSSIEIIKEDKHVFTHLVWEMTFVACHVDIKKTTDLPEMRWIREDLINDYALPTAFKRLIGEK